MRHRIALALVLVLITGIPSHSRAQGQGQGQAKKQPPPPPPPPPPPGPDEVPGSQSQIIAGVATGGFSCGRETYPLYCYGIPANVGGTFWLDVSYNATPSQTGFVSFNSVLDLGQGTITGATFTTNSLGQITQMDIVFNGTTNDGDNGAYTGTGSFTFSYVYSSGGGGKGNLGGYVQLLQTGSLTITYQ